MARKTEFNHIKTKRGWMVASPPGLSASGLRERCYFNTRDKAREYAAGLREKAKMNGENATAIRLALAEAAVQAESILEPWGLSLVHHSRTTTDRGCSSGCCGSGSHGAHPQRASFLEMGGKQRMVRGKCF